VSEFFTWNAPEGPSTPFGSGVMLFDLLRVIVLMLCLVIMMMSISAAGRPEGTLGQKVRLIGSALAFFLFIGGTELEHFGDYGHWRLYVGLLASSMVSWGMWSLFKFEAPSEFKAKE
jgi:hypothetical protein